MRKKEIKKEMGYGGPQDVSRKVQRLEQIAYQIKQTGNMLASFEFQKGFPEDSAKDIDEAAELLQKAGNLLSGFTR